MRLRTTCGVSFPGLSDRDLFEDEPSLQAFLAGPLAPKLEHSSEKSIKQFDVVDDLSKITQGPKILSQSYVIALKIRKEVKMNNVKEIMNGVISAILIATGYVVLWCGIICLSGNSVGNMADETGGILMCSMGCLIFSVILIGSGIAWYYIVKPKS